MFFDGVVYFMIEIDDVFVGVIGFGLFYLILLFLVFLVLFATASCGAALVLLARGCRRILLALEHDFGKDIIPKLAASGDAWSHKFSDSCIKGQDET